MKHSIWLWTALLALGCDDGTAPADAPAKGSGTSAGQASGAPSDAAVEPGVPGALTIEEAQKAAKDAPDSLRDKQVKVSGVVAKIGTQTAGPANKKSVTYYIQLTPALGQKKPNIHCDTHMEEPKVAEGAAVTVEGRGEVTKMQAEDGSTFHRLDLRECRVL